MMPAMLRSRVLGLATLIVGATALGYVAFGCSSKGHSGDSSLKDFDCESGRCVQFQCMYVGNNPIAPVDVGVDAGPADTGPADTGPADTGATADAADAD